MGGFCDVFSDAMIHMDVVLILLGMFSSVDHSVNLDFIHGNSSIFYHPFSGITAGVIDHHYIYPSSVHTDFLDISRIFLSKNFSGGLTVVAMLPSPDGSGLVPPSDTVSGSSHVVPLVLERYPYILIFLLDRIFFQKS